MIIREKRAQETINEQDGARNSGRVLKDFLEGEV